MSENVLRTITILVQLLWYFGLFYCVFESMFGLSCFCTVWRYFSLESLVHTSQIHDVARVASSNILLTAARPRYLTLLFLPQRPQYFKLDPSVAFAQDPRDDNNVVEVPG